MVSSRTNDRITEVFFTPYDASIIPNVFQTATPTIELGQRQWVMFTRLPLAVRHEGSRSKRSVSLSTSAARRCSRRSP